MVAGTVANKAIAPDQLRAYTKNVPGGAGGTAQTADADYLVRLDATGHIDAGFLTVRGLNYLGNKDLTVAYVAPAGLKNGDFATVTKKGTADASWPGFNGKEALDVGDMVIYGGTQWHLVQHGIDLNSLVHRSGPNAIIKDMTMTWDAPDSLATIIDGGDPTKSQIDNVMIDCGTY
jgi:hypothetical protein